MPALQATPANAAGENFNPRGEGRDSKGLRAQLDPDAGGPTSADGRPVVCAPHISGAQAGVAP